MTENVTLEQNPSPAVSTTLDPNPIAAHQNGGGEVKDTPERPESVADSIRSVIKEADEKSIKAEEAKDDKPKADVSTDNKEKPEPAEKARGEDGKFAKAKTEDDPAKVEADKGAAEKPATERAEQDEKRSSEGRKYAEPPARFLPEARTKWANVPNEVKAEFHRVSQEYEQREQQTRQSVERYESIRQFDDMARSNGRELKDSLAKMVQIEQALARSPIMGLEMILREIGPRKADGSPLSLHDIATHVARLTPQQFAQNMGQMNQPRPAQQQADPKVVALEQKLAAMEGRLAEQSATPIIERFAAEHPDYHSLEQQIATVLKSGIIEQTKGSGLTPEQRLAEAYRIAGGAYPSSQSAQAAQDNPALTQVPPKDRPVDPAGQKSITGALNSRGDDPDDTDDAESDDIRTMLKKGMRRAV